MNNHFSENVKAKSNIINGFVFAIPAALAGGLVGALASVGLGFLFAKKEIQIEKDGYDYLASNKMLGVNKYTNLSEEDRYLLIKHKFENIEISEIGLVQSTNLSTDMFLSKLDELCGANDFKMVALKYHTYSYDYGFYANNKYYFVDKITAAKLQQDFYNKQLKEMGF